MLNEKEELMQYIGKISDCTRLNSWFFFKKNRAGIPRALTIIARHYLFDVYNYSALENEQQIAAREKTKHLLAAWCGFDYLKDSDEYIDTALIDHDNIKDWLPNYLLAHPWEKKSIDDYMKNELASFKQERAPKWYVRDQNCIYQLVNHTFSINSINFYTIIADAINQGPLREMELVYDKDALSKDTKMRDKERESIVCIVAAYLLALKDQEPANQPIDLNNVDLANWINYPSLARSKNINSKFKKVAKYISYSDGNYIVQKEFIEKYGFAIKK